MDKSFKYNIYYDIEQSDIFHEINNLKFYFSSTNLKNTFIEKIKTIEVDKEIFERKYYCKIEDISFLLIRQYKKTERRGFRIEDSQNKNIKNISVLLEF